MLIVAAVFLFLFLKFLCFLSVAFNNKRIPFPCSYLFASFFLPTLLPYSQHCPVPSFFSASFHLFLFQVFVFQLLFSLSLFLLTCFFNIEHRFFFLLLMFSLAFLAWICFSLHLIVCFGFFLLLFLLFLDLFLWKILPSLASFFLCQPPSFLVPPPSELKYCHTMSLLIFVILVTFWRGNACAMFSFVSCVIRLCL